MAAAAARVDNQHQVLDDTPDMTVGEALQNGPSLRVLVLGDDGFLPAVKDGYKSDNMFSKIVDNPGHYLTFRVVDGIIHMKN